MVCGVRVSSVTKVKSDSDAGAGAPIFIQIWQPRTPGGLARPPPSASVRAKWITCRRRCDVSMGASGAVGVGRGGAVLNLLGVASEQTLVGLPFRIFGLPRRLGRRLLRDMIVIVGPPRGLSGLNGRDFGRRASRSRGVG